MRKSLLLPLALLLLGLSTSAYAVTGEVTLSGSTWTGKTDGVTRYTGSDMAAAMNACAANMGSGGTINVRNSGAVNTQVRIFGGTRVNGNGCTFSGNTGVNVGVIKAQNVSNVGADNINLNSGSTYGMYFSTCNGTTFSGVNGTAWKTYRIDNCKGGTGYNFTCGSPYSTGSAGSDFIETYGISGVAFSKVTCTDRGGCGVLVNYSSGVSGGTVTATRCNYGGGYAGFRTANNNRSTTLTYDNATSCGRGFFSVSGSSGATLTRVNAYGCSSHGLWLQSTSNSRVYGGTIQACNPCSAISQDLGGNTVTVTCR